MLLLNTAYSLERTAFVGDLLIENGKSSRLAPLFPAKTQPSSTSKDSASFPGSSTRIATSACGRTAWVRKARTETR